MRRKHQLHLCNVMQCDVAPLVTKTDWTVLEAHLSAFTCTIRTIRFKPKPLEEVVRCQVLGTFSDDDIHVKAGD
jgi:hypothetical protein